jgi:hypothetical protein
MAPIHQLSNDLIILNFVESVDQYAVKLGQILDEPNYRFKERVQVWCCT